MYLNHDEILELCRSGAIENYDESCINAASLDVRIGNQIQYESSCRENPQLDYRKRERPDMQRLIMSESGFNVPSGLFFLTHTMERCNFPDDIAALFRIKSSMGRIGLEHMDAGWVDPGFNGSLTLEFKLMLNQHSVLLRPGDRIGQLIFFRGKPVSADKSYRATGNYNGAAGIKNIGFAEEAQ